MPTADTRPNAQQPVAPTYGAHPPDVLDAGELYRRHGDFVARFLIRLGVGVQELPDVVQEVFVVAHRRGGYTPGPARPTTWLGQICVHMAQNHRRRMMRREISDTIRVEEAHYSRDPRADAETHEALVIVQRALDTLSIRQRAVFILYELERESCEAIASAMNLPVGTVYSRLHSARRKFRVAFERLSAEPDEYPSQETSS